MTDPVKTYRGPAVFKAAGITGKSYNEAVCSGAIQNAPETNRGQRRWFTEKEAIDVFRYTGLLRVGFKRKAAGQHTLKLTEAHCLPMGDHMHLDISGHVAACLHRLHEVGG